MKIVYIYNMLKSIGFILCAIAVPAFCIPLYADVISSDVIPKKTVKIKNDKLSKSELEVAVAKCTKSDLDYFSKDLSRLQIAGRTQQHHNIGYRLFIISGIVLLAGGAAFVLARGIAHD